MKNPKLDIRSIEPTKTMLTLPPALLWVILTLSLVPGVGAGTAELALDWWAISGGSGTSTSAVYVVSGTVGQPHTGCLAGGAYTCDGGFWSVVAALQTSGAPPLTITLNAQLSTVTVAWLLPATGWVLDQAQTLTGTTIPWTPVPATQYQTNATHISMTIAAPAGNRFYRLRGVP